MNPFIGFIVSAVILAIIFVPFAAVWALNVLFGLAIPCTFETWVAIVVLVGVLQPVTIFSRK